MHACVVWKSDLQVCQWACRALVGEKTPARRLLPAHLDPLPPPPPAKKIKQQLAFLGGVAPLRVKDSEHPMLQSGVNAGFSYDIQKLGESARKGSARKICIETRSQHESSSGAPLGVDAIFSGSLPCSHFGKRRSLQGYLGKKPCLTSGRNSWPIPRRPCAGKTDLFCAGSLLVSLGFRVHQADKGAAKTRSHAHRYHLHPHESRHRLKLLLQTHHPERGPSQCHGWEKTAHTSNK